ncbi:MAG: type II toxin-antitoxin system VapC family toxin [Fibrobacteria bacterium]
MAEDSVLLDTHVWWWFAMRSDRLAETAALNLIRKALVHNQVLISVMSVWEIAMLESKHRIRLYQGLNTWVKEALASPGVRLQGLTPSIAIESTRLPGEFHADPMDRILVATARELNIPILTADAAIIAYANSNHVKAVEV